MRILFFGTPLFAAEVLSFLLEKGISIVGIISKPDLPKGRGLHLEETPVKKVAKEHPEIPFFQPLLVSDPAFYPLVEALQPDLFVVVAYGEIIKDALLQKAKVAAINLHTSLLPKYRGAAPIQRAIMAGEETSGVTIIHMTKKMDAGDMILQKEVQIDPNDTYGMLEGKLLLCGKELLLESINLLEKGSAPRTPQPEIGITFAPKVELEECEIRFRDMTAESIHNLVRGATPEPGAYTWVEIAGQKKRLKIFAARKLEGSSEPATLHTWGKGGLILGTCEGLIELLELQLEGKKRLSAQEFMCGQKKENIRW